MRNITNDGMIMKMMIGSAAGAVGTAALYATSTVDQKIVPEAAAPIRKDPGMFMVQQAERILPIQARQRIPEGVEKAAAQYLGWEYGMTFGAIYSMLRPRGGPIVTDGIALGLGCWAAGYLGWLPATGLMKPVWRQKPKQVAGPILEHIVYGVATVAAHHLLTNLFSPKPVRRVKPESPHEYRPTPSGARTELEEFARST